MVENTVRHPRLEALSIRTLAAIPSARDGQETRNGWRQR